MLEQCGLAQRIELEERKRQLQELDVDEEDLEELDTEAKVKYKEPAQTLIDWDDENAQLSSALGKSSPSPSIPVAQPPSNEPEHSKASASSAAAQRRAKNAAQISSGLLSEVCRLQSLLGEHDKAIQDMKEEKDDLEASAESLRKALKQQEQSAEEKSNLKVTLQNLCSELSNAQSTNSRLDSEHKCLNKLLATATTRDTAKQFKNETSQLQSSLEELTNKHETDIALARKHAASLAHDKSNLQQTIDTLKTEVPRAGRRLPRFGSPLTPNGAEPNDFLTPGGISMPATKTNDMGAYDDAFGDDFEDSAKGSPIPGSLFRSANHPLNELEVLQQRLAHAQRQISTLKGTLQREKKEKLDLKRKFGVQGSEDEDDLLNEDSVVEEGGDGDDTVGPNNTLSPVNGKRRKPLTLTAGRGSRGRLRGRGGRRGLIGDLTLTERFNLAACELDDQDDLSPERGSTSPSAPSIHLADEDAFYNLEEEDQDQVPEHMGFQVSPSPVPSNRTSVGSITSVEGMDPAFANVLRRTPSTSSVVSVQANGSRGTGVGVGRRVRGGAAWHDGRPPSLVDQPEDLARALGASIGASPVSIKDDGSGIGIMEELGAEVIETAEFGCQTEPELVPLVPDKPLSDAFVQYEPEPDPMPLVTPPPPAAIFVEIATQTIPEPVVRHDEAAVQHLPSLVGISTDPLPNTHTAEVEAWMNDEIRERQDTILPDVSTTSSTGDSTIKDAPVKVFLTSLAIGTRGKVSDDGEETETGAEMDQATTWTQGKVLYLLLHNEVSDSDADDGESIKDFIILQNRAGSSSEAAVMTPPTLYESKSLAVYALPKPVEVAPKDWMPPASVPLPQTPVESPAPSSGSPALYHVGSSSKQQFQFIPPPPIQAPSSAPVLVPTPLPSIR
ncbi:hypothetical protein C8R42DRAFT_723402 [Lentinula raphanica]|nr:hypothetical protein C8R42DRAFT_723402 [Lentinula raphanica]